MKRAALLMCLVLAAARQEKAQDIVDFTRSPNEHMINEINHPFVVTSVAGTITLQRGGPLSGVLFEIKGHGDDRRTRRGTTEENGSFKIGRLPQGTYRFKAAFTGFQSVMGTIIAIKKVAKAHEIRIDVHVGV